MTVALRRTSRLLRLTSHILASLPIALFFAWQRRQGHLHQSSLRPAMEWWFRGILRALEIRIELHGAPLDRPHLCVANHVSWLDIMALGAMREGRFLAKEEVAAWPLFGWLARVTGTLFVKRGSAREARASMQGIADRLAAGESVLLFPEGTTTQGDRVAPFHAGMLEAASLAGRPIQPVALSYLDERRNPSQVAPFVGEEGLGSHIWRLLELPELTVRLHYLPPIPGSVSRREAAALSHKVIAAAVRNDWAGWRGVEVVERDESQGDWVVAGVAG
ncbi:MAG: 1-acyl-sn-glycerol-3-phosphate acyltransferase [Alphaproteobacteria bacterium CG_4_10_14_0_2_um_filter_63_37]|nr:MAG: hypothetical protein AUJ55_01010 [Proteobacteria bacterium CG1_02_64_396]PJA25798.1 MAG: 1-acyl-sn-glycerol-3-phosphate acyltransferase [Alphaproteobacteria bacterium CG_4_10_14_0_2_um_filter_63_37]